MLEGLRQEFTCVCGKKKGWIEAEKVTATPCPACGRYYRGVYNEDTLQIEAEEVEVEEDD